MARRSIGVLALLLLGCPSREAPAPASGAPSSVVSVARPPASTQTPPSALRSADPTPPKARRENDSSKWKPGETVIARGRISKLYGQHVMTGVTGKTEAYFDLAGGAPQTIVYWQKAPACSGDIEVTGKVLEVKAAPGSKAGDGYSELHLDVTSTRCAE
jgi:hypothetical protein